MGASIDCSFLAPGKPPITALSKSCKAAWSELDVDRHGAAYIVLVEEVLMQLGFTAPGQAWIRLQERTYGSHASQLTNVSM